jgi:effector-binding domain-containing protein
MAGAEAFVPVRPPTAPDPRIAYRRLPAIRAATVIHTGSYATIRLTRAALEGWVMAAGFRPSGPLRVTYLQFGGEPELALPPDYLVEHDTDFVTELQLPVEA